MVCSDRPVYGGPRSQLGSRTSYSTRPAIGSSDVGSSIRACTQRIQGASFQRWSYTRLTDPMGRLSSLRSHGRPRLPLAASSHSVFGSSASRPLAGTAACPIGSDSRAQLIIPNAVCGKAGNGTFDSGSSTRAALNRRLRWSLSAWASSGLASSVSLCSRSSYLHGTDSRNSDCHDDSPRRGGGLTPSLP